VRSSRLRTLQRDAAVMIPDLKAYAVQNRAGIQSVYDVEPDEGYWPELVDREAELWGPLLIHARIVGRDAEEKLLEVVRSFIHSKADIEADDLNAAKAIAVLEALEGIDSEEFSPGDLVTSLDESDAWASTFSKVKGADEKARRKGQAQKIGYFLRNFRLSCRLAGGGFKKYPRKDVIDTLRRHTPENHHKHPNHHQTNHHPSERLENTGPCDACDSCDAFGDIPKDGHIESGNSHASNWCDGVACPGCRGAFPIEHLDAHLLVCPLYLKQQGDTGVP
jgi:hypothetical protein